MKKLLLLAAFAFAAMPAFAQTSNNSDVDQTGSDNVADVNQSGTNTSDIDQTANKAGAFVDQDGTNNKSTIEQSDETVDTNTGGSTGIPGLDPDATVNQTGNDNTSDIIQAAEGFRDRNLTATVNQSVGNNDSDINQFAGGDDTFSGTLSATVSQTGDADSDIDQDAISVGEQTSNFSATVTQDASTSDITQFGQGGVIGLSATVNQANGASSTIEQESFGLGTFNVSAAVTQDGASDSKIFQTYNEDLSNNFSATVDQLGDDHKSTITQEDFGGGSGGDSNVTAFVDQDGMANTSTLTQINRGHSATIVQSGNDNTSTGTQGSVDNNLEVTQSGDGNKSVAEQTSTNSDIFVTQSGDNNNSNVLQTFRKSTATVFQHGTDGRVDIDQVENARGDQATVNQAALSTNSRATILQRGNLADGSVDSNNMATINQNEGDFNRSTIVQSGIGNMAITTQTNDNNVSNITQTGSNTATVVQN